MRKAYSYTRFSSPEQASGDSIRRQMAGTEAWIARNPDVELDTQLVFADYGRSGFRGQQFSDGALGRFVDSVRSGAIKKGSYLLIENLDRFSRENPMTATSRLFDLANMGITIVTTSDGLEYSTDTLSGGDVSRLLMLVLQLSQAHVESAKKAERVGAAWARKKAAAREGKHKVSARCPGWLTLVDDEFVLIDDRVKVVQDIFRWTIEGAGRREIARRLNIADPPVLPFKHAEKRRPGRPPPTGWHASAVAKILQNRAVLGEYQPGKGSHKSGNYRPDGDPIPNYYPRIIDDETFWQAKAASQRRRTGAAGPRGKAGSHMLKGLVRCAACGGPMHVLNKGTKPKGGVYLACSAALRSAGCGMSRRWRLDKLESDVLHSLEYLEPATLFDADEGVNRALAKVQSLKARLEAADAVRKRLLAAVRLSDDEEAAANFAEQAKVVKALRKELKEAEVEAATSQADPGLAARLTDATSLSLQLDTADDDQRRELRIRLNEILRGLVEKIVFSDDLGAVMEMKPWLGQKRLAGRVPFATTITAVGGAGAMVARVLLERDPEAARRFVMGDNGEAREGSPENPQRPE